MYKTIFRFVSYNETLRFKYHQRNRLIDKRHLEEIKKQVLKSLGVMPPIVVNVITGVIIDGQHRYEAYKQLIEAGLLPADTKLQVMFVSISPEEELETIINSQIHARKWSPWDYIRSYVEAGNDSYIILDAWCKTHAVCMEGEKTKPRYAAAMMKGRNCQTELTNGSFTVTNEEVENAENIYNEIITICDILNIGTTGTWFEAMIISWYRNRKLHTFDVWRNMIKKRKERLISYPKQKVKDWEAIFSQLHQQIDLAA